MPISPTYPGVYIEEIPSGVRAITGVATSITAFIGRTRRGPDNKATRIQSFAEFGRSFGGLWAESPLSYAVQQYFAHGGSDAYIVRVARKDAVSATIPLATTDAPLELEAIGPGVWGNNLRAAVDYQETKDPTNANGENLYTLIIQELESAGSNRPVVTETFRNLSSNPIHPRYVKTVIKEESRLVEIKTNVAATQRPEETVTDRTNRNNAANFTLADGIGADGTAVQAEDVEGDEAQRTGIYALETADLFNMMCIPSLTRDDDVPDSTLKIAANYCKTRRAVLLIDSPSGWSDVSAAENGINDLRNNLGDAKDHAAAYFPYIEIADPLQENRYRPFPPSGAVAGIIARTDAQRGIWKAPAGLEASFSGVRKFSYEMTDAQNGRLNPLGLNCLRNLGVYGNVVWGTRTLDGADALSSDWKYLPIRRLALYIEESLYRGTQWVVFEPNDEPLWAQIRLNVGAFMHNLFRQGAFQGSSPRDAYFVKCDHETTPQSDINLGIVNIEVGFAPLQPAEFVIIKLQQQKQA